MGRLHLPVAPSVEGVDRLGHDRQVHMSMLIPTELRATAMPDTRLVNFDRQDVVASRNHVAFARQIGQPDRMNDISRFEVQLNPLTDREMQFVSGPEYSGGVLIEVANFPPPLVARD